jgi:hypothetical protein
MRKCLPLFIIGFMLYSCVDEIDLGQGTPLPDGIVIRGRLTASAPAEAVVNVERLFEFTSNRPDIIVSADVTLENTEGQTLEMKFGEGAYRVSLVDRLDFDVAPGIGYRVRVSTVDGGEYLSEYDILPEPTAADSIRTELATTSIVNRVGVREDIPVLNYLISSPVRYDDGSPVFIRYTAERTYAITQVETPYPIDDRFVKVCYIPETVAGTRAIILSGRDLSGDRVVDFELLSDPIDYRYAQGHYLALRQEVISEEAFDYFTEIAAIADQSESIFTNPPGPVRGNVREVNERTENVFGFFYTANRSLIRIGTTPEEAGNPRFRCPPLPRTGPSNPPEVCEDCLSPVGSTTQKPFYWTLF